MLFSFIALFFTAPKDSNADDDEFSVSMQSSTRALNGERMCLHPRRQFEYVECPIFTQLVAYGLLELGPFRHGFPFSRLHQAPVTSTRDCRCTLGIRYLL